MNMSSAGIALLKKYEGFRQEAYWDNGMYSIGYGHRDKSIKKGQTISPDEAEKFLREDVAGAEACITRNFLSKGIKLTQSQFDACVSLAYNCGCSGFVGTDAAKALQSGDYKLFGELLPNTKASSDGLKTRRKAELALFNGSSGGGSTTATASASGAVQKAGTDLGKVALITGVVVGVSSVLMTAGDFVMRWFKKR